MIRLGLKKEDRWIELGRGVSILVNPLTTAIYRSAVTTAYRKANAVAVERSLIEEAGGTISGIENPVTRDNISGLQSQFMLQSLAVHVIKDWKGIGDINGNPIPVSEAAICELIRDFPILCSRFETDYIRELSELDDEGNGSGAERSGISPAAPDTAEDAILNAEEIALIRNTAREASKAVQSGTS
jgi:hypothetical protein